MSNLFGKPNGLWKGGSEEQRHRKSHLCNKLSLIIFNWNQFDLFGVELKSMFASNTAEVLNFEKKDKSPDALKSILDIHKKLKEIARIESNIRPKYKVAKLTQEKLQKIRNLEENIDYCLVAYDANSDLSYKKHKLLENIKMLLDDYKNLLQSTKSNNSDDSFNELFAP